MSTPRPPLTMGKLKNKIGRMRTAAPNPRETGHTLQILQVQKTVYLLKVHTHTWSCLTVPLPAWRELVVSFIQLRCTAQPESGPLSQKCSSPPQLCALSEPRAPGPGSGQVQRFHVLSSRSFDPQLQTVGLRTTGSVSRVLT